MRMCARACVCISSKTEKEQERATEDRREDTPRMRKGETLLSVIDDAVQSYCLSPHCTQESRQQTHANPSKDDNVQVIKVYTLNTAVAKIVLKKTIAFIVRNVEQNRVDDLYSQTVEMVSYL